MSGRKAVPDEAAVRKLAAARDPDPRHTAHVTGLSLRLFDALEAVHRLGPGARRLLETAARLHDIGWSGNPGPGHHKRSRDMILSADIGLDGRGRTMCALIARYHTKALPDPERHRRFAGLRGPDRAAVEWLAGILRVADGLDCTHAARVGIKGCSAGRTRIVIRLRAPAGSVEIDKARRKADLLRRAAGRAVVLEP